MERNNLVGGQGVTRAGVLNLIHDDVIADVGLHQGLDFGQRRAGRRRVDGMPGRDAPGQAEQNERPKTFQFHAAR